MLSAIMLTICTVTAVPANDQESALREYGDFLVGGTWSSPPGDAKWESCYTWIEEKRCLLKRDRILLPGSVTPRAGKTDNWEQEAASSSIAITRVNKAGRIEECEFSGPVLNRYVITQVAKAAWQFAVRSERAGVVRYRPAFRITRLGPDKLQVDPASQGDNDSAAAPRVMLRRKEAIAPITFPDAPRTGKGDISPRSGQGPGTRTDIDTLGKSEEMIGNCIPAPEMRNMSKPTPPRHLSTLPLCLRPLSSRYRTGDAAATLMMYCPNCFFAAPGTSTANSTSGFSLPGLSVKDSRSATRNRTDEGSEVVRTTESFPVPSPGIRSVVWPNSDLLPSLESTPVIVRGP